MTKENINFEYFEKLDIRIGTIEEVVKVENADKLLMFTIDFGEEKRQIVSSIADYVSDLESLVDKQMPVLLNLEPKKFRGVESQGMILMADVDGKPIFLYPEKNVPNGSEVK